MRALVNSVWTTIAFILAIVIAAVAIPASAPVDPEPGSVEVIPTDSAQGDSPSGDSRSDTASTTDASSSEPIEFDAPIVVEADHDTGHTGSRDPRGLIRGSAHIVDADVQADMEQHAVEAAEASERTRETMVGVPPVNYGALSGGIVAEYNTTYPAPSNVRAVVDAVINQWDSVLATNPSGPIVVEFLWADLGNPSLLGYAGPDGMFYGGGLPGGALYPAPLANTLLGSDVNGASRPEIQVVLNSQLAASGRWYINASGAPAGNQIDLYSVALHEVGHGLGFLGSGEVQSGQSHPSLSSPVFAYDKLASYNGSALTSQPDPGPAMVSGNLQTSVSNGILLDLYAPASWAAGSSFSHFDEATYQAGDPGSLMTPALASGEANRSVDSVSLGLLARLGWPVAVKAVTPTIVTSSQSSSSVTVIWSQGLHQPGVAPDSYNVEAWRDGVVLQSSVTVPGSAGGATVGSLSAGGDYTVQVVPVGPGGTGTAAAVNVTLPSSDAGSITPSYVRYRPLDGRISRLYQAYFLRQPDQGGYDYWLDILARGGEHGAMSDAFAGSGEFQSRYGSLGDAQFIDLVYGNVLQRSADPEGRSYWIGQLAQGVSRGAVMIGFAESGEFIVRTDSAAPTSSVQGRIERLYQAFFLRSPDTAGLNYWMGQANAGASLETIAASFAQSPEFQSRYGSVDDQQFVSLVYTNVLGRSADAGGLAYWTGLLQGGLGRGPMMVQFSESIEFIKSTGTIP